MADIMINYAGVQAQVDELEQAANQMRGAVDTLVQTLNQVQQSFHGSSASQFGYISSHHTQWTNELNTLLQKGNVTLQQMMQELNDGDRRGASILGG